MSGIFKVVELAGSQSALARLLGINPQAVQQWVQKGYVPFPRAEVLENMFKVPFEQLINPKYRKTTAIKIDRKTKT